MQYTLRNIPPDLDEALREKARAEGKSLNEAALDALRSALAIAAPMSPKRDLSDIWGKSKPDPELDAALAEGRKIDWEEWQ